MFQQRIFRQTQAYVDQIHRIQRKAMNPQKLLLFLISSQFSFIQCTDKIPNSKKKQKVKQQVAYLEQKRTNFTKNNQDILDLLKIRHQKYQLLQKTLHQRNKTELKLQTNFHRAKFGQKDASLQTVGINKQINNKNVMKQNAKYYHYTNLGLKCKIQELKKYISNIQRHNSILTEQRYRQNEIDSFKKDDISFKMNRNDSLHQNHCIKHHPQAYKQISPYQITKVKQSDYWIQKMDYMKRKHLSPQRNYNRKQILQNVKSLNHQLMQSPRFKKQQNLSMSKNRIDTSRSKQKIFSNKFWYCNAMDNKGSNQHISPKNFPISPRNIKQNENSIYFVRQPRISLTNRVQQKSLSRVKSLGSLNSTNQSINKSYRSIYR